MLFWVLNCSGVFFAGHVTGLCYLKHDAALGGVGGGVIILQCYRAKNENSSFIEGERVMRQIAYSSGLNVDCRIPPHPSF